MTESLFFTSQRICILHHSSAYVNIYLSILYTPVLRGFTILLKPIHYSSFKRSCLAHMAYLCQLPCLNLFLIMLFYAIQNARLLFRLPSSMIFASGTLSAGFILAILRRAPHSRYAAAEALPILFIPLALFSQSYGSNRRKSSVISIRHTLCTLPVIFTCHSSSIWIQSLPPGMCTITSESIIPSL